MTINFDQDTETLARWANSLNRWTWPDDIPDKDIFLGLPANSQALSSNQLSQSDAIMLALIEIKQRIGDKEILRYHHLHNLKIKNEDFETWWAEKGEPFLNTKVALSVHFDDNGLPVANAEVIK